MQHDDHSDGEMKMSKINVFTKFLVVCGPSGAGKGTILQLLFDQFPGFFQYSVSHTSRKPRSGEIHGQQYYFESRDKLLSDISNGLFLEYTEYAGSIYGTSLQELERIHQSQKIGILELEMQGVKQIKLTALSTQMKFLFIKPPCFDILKERLKARGTNSAEDIENRMMVARNELRESENIEFDFYLTNDKLDDSYRQVREVLLSWFPALRLFK
ncbi:guanylate kinase family protein [Cardiosporidium cionae]|uniref:guanylate kinase n=1 Tax=Cardiosporidium cionae TaxID=476202 RepID=A0ABQ7J7A2_9APIC|nr:guanylate kinase family protein [Cardiosporidium cionae]|eukprot:KAF8819856.1 guanylate kinase family protein [Cardiosporidium cionae]